MQNVEPRDSALIQLLCKRDGQLTIAVFADGSEANIYNIAWVYDLGDEFAHVTTNINPMVEGADVDFFLTSEIVELVDGEWRAPLFSFPN